MAEQAKAPGWWERATALPNLLDGRQAMLIALVIVLLMAAWFRFHGLNWDSGRHLHPDERFLSTVTNDIQWPQNFANYFNPTASSLSPYSLPNMGLFVYGTLPVYLVKWAAIILDSNNYDEITMVGRAMSVLFDLGAIFLLFLVGRRLYGQKVALLAAALMSLCVFSIQLSHFYTVDTFANLFILAAFYFILRYSAKGGWSDYVLAGLMLGLGLASKVSVVTLVVPVLLGAWLDFRRRTREAELSLALEQSLVRVVTLFILAALIFRVLQPIAFSGPGFLGLSLNPQWLDDVREQSNLLSGTADLPWVQQWTSRSALYPLYNIVVWGLGLPLGLAGLAGFGLALYELLRRRNLEHLLPVVYVGVTFVYHALTFIKFMRYFLPIYPFLVLFAAYLIARLWSYATRPAESRPAAESREEQAGEAEGEAETTQALPPPAAPGRLASLRGRLARFRYGQQLALASIAFILLGTALYALAFSSIYSREHSRIAASRWMYTTLPAGSTLANEHWDDWLPIGGLDGYASYGDQGMFTSVEMRNYEDDNPAKLDQMVTNLTEADFVVLSSNRLYDSIPRLPMRYPLTSRYYELLFSGQLGFKRVAEFTSYPGLFGLEIPDQAAEESFSVYDHPRVQIFQKTAAFDPQSVRELLQRGVNWGSVTHLTPRQASSAPTGLLMLSPRLQALYQSVSTWSSAEISDTSLGSHFPVAAWILVLLTIGVLALPLTLVTFGRLADRGYIFSKAVGLLVISWGAWMLASLRIAPFTWWAILLVLLALAIASGVLGWRRRDELRGFLRSHWRLLLVQEGLFWAFFALSLFIRWNNPDLWHPGLGGEKPMDLAYLTAVARTPYFPPYDPWFAGGYINYYYFGFVLAAVLMHLTGLLPHIAYNLAVPTFFAMTAMGGFAVAYNLAEWWQSHRGSASPEVERIKPGGEASVEGFLVAPPEDDGAGQASGGRRSGLTLGTLLAGLGGALFVAVIGNLAQVELIWNGVRALSPIQTTEGATPLLSIMQFADGASQWLAERSLHLRTEWWYWNATRVIDAAQGEAGPINEMPFFTFLYGDLHAHMMTLPYTLLALGLALNIVRSPSASRERRESRGGAWWRNASEVLTLALLALTIGALWPMNTWDFPTYTALAGAALLIREVARRGRLDWPGLWAAAWRLGVVVVAGRLLFQPFHSNYGAAYFGAELWKGSRTGLKDYLLIHGFFLFVLVTYLLVELVKGQGHNALVRRLRLPLRHWRRYGRAQSLLEALVRPAASLRLGISLSTVAFVLVLVAILLRPVIGIALGLIVLTALLLFSTRPDPRRQFLLCMIGLGLLLTAAVEVVVLKGDISRMNTVFKFYLQVWVMWAVASAGVLPELADRLRARRAAAAAPASAAEAPGGGAVEAQTARPSQTDFEPEEGSAWTPEVQARYERPRARRAQTQSRSPSRPRAWSAVWWSAFGVLLVACFLYPLTATPVRMGDRFENSTAKTLDGSRYMRTSVYYDDSRPVTLEADREAFEWLRDNVKGMPTLLEANTQPKLYSWGSRASINTGLPTVIGWDWHQKQQRALMPGPMVDQRINDVRTIYTSTDLNQVSQLLRQYGVRYIYLGELERLYYGGEGLVKFDQPSDLWSLVYDNDGVRIYEVH
jgi:YYY domain-containing protein